jgi:hypothetical protein
LPVVYERDVTLDYLLRILEHSHNSAYFYEVLLRRDGLFAIKLDDSENGEENHPSPEKFSWRRVADNYFFHK